MNAIYSVASLAKHWGCGTDTVYSLIHSGDLKAFKLGGKLFRIRADEVERYECQTNTPSNDTEASSPSSSTKVDDATAIRLERLTVRPPSPQRAPSGSGAASAER